MKVADFCMNSWIFAPLRRSFISKAGNSTSKWKFCKIALEKSLRAEFMNKQLPCRVRHTKTAVFI